MPSLPPWLCASFALGHVAGVLYLHPPRCITCPLTVRRRWESFPSPLVVGALLLQVPHSCVVLVQLENQARGTSSSLSRLSTSTPSAAAEPSSALVRTPFPTSPPRFSCSGRYAEVQWPFPLSLFDTFADVESMVGSPPCPLWSRPHVVTARHVSAGGAC
jgi:hypothetical protein